MITLKGTFNGQPVEVVITIDPKAITTLVIDVQREVDKLPATR